MMRTASFSLVLLLAATAPGRGQAPAPTPAPSDPKAWIAESNRQAQVLLDIQARFSPEGAGAAGMSGLDREISSLTQESRKAERQALEAALATLEARLASEPQPLVRQDLQILISAARNSIREMQISDERLVPYVDVPMRVYQGLRSLLDPQVAAGRRSAAVNRLRKYAGLDGGLVPLTTQAIRRTREGLANPRLLPPARSKVERDLSNDAVVVTGIEKMLAEYQLEGWREPYAALARQLAEYETFVRNEVLPRARTDFRLPPELYAFSLEQVGVDIAPEPLAAMAHQAFRDIQQQMAALAPGISRARGLETSDYRAVVRALKKEQLVGEAILPHYRKRLEEIEAIVRREKLVTLAGGSMRSG